VVDGDDGAGQGQDAHGVAVAEQRSTRAQPSRRPYANCVTSTGASTPNAARKLGDRHSTPRPWPARQLSLWAGGGRHSKGFRPPLAEGRGR